MLPNNSKFVRLCTITKIGTNVCYTLTTMKRETNGCTNYTKNNYRKRMVTKGNGRAFVGKNVDGWFSVDGIVDIDGHKLTK